MSSLVEELQAGAMNPDVPISTLLRQAKVVAYKLDLPELLEWAEQELKGCRGQGGPVRKYRQFTPRIEAFDPDWGWKTVIIEDTVRRNFCPSLSGSVLRCHSLRAFWRVRTSTRFSYPCRMLCVYR